MPFPYGKDNLAGIGKYLANVRDKYYNSGGMRVIQLKEVIVEAKQKQRNFYATMAEKTITSDQVPVNMQSRLVTDYLSTVPGISETVGSQTEHPGKRYRTADPNRRSTLLR